MLFAYFIGVLEVSLMAFSLCALSCSKRLQVGSDIVK